MSDARFDAFNETRNDLRAPGRSRTGKTRKKPNCTPPNVVCGSRCIPPNWECREKGKGTDSHSAAKRTDPLSGIANIERGIKRGIRGVKRGSFSDLDGSINSVIRGVVKITPGTLAEKKERTRKLRERAVGIGVGLAVVTGGLIAHSQTKRLWPTYADGVGADIDNAVRNGWNGALDRTPIIGQRRRRIATEANFAANNVGIRLRQSENVTGATLNANIATNNAQYTGTNTRPGNRIRVLNNIAAVATTYGSRVPPPTLDEWNTASLRAFWGTRRPGMGQTDATVVTGTGSVAPRLNPPGSAFSEPAAMDFIARQYNIDTAVVRGRGVEATSEYVLTRATASIAAESAALRADARNKGFDITRSGDEGARARNAYAQALMGGSLPRPVQGFNADVVTHIDRMLQVDSNSSARNLVRAQYRRTLAGFDEYYNNIYNYTNSVGRPNVTIPATDRDIVANARIGHATGLASSTPSTRIRNQPILGQGHAALVTKNFYHTVVVPTSRYMVTTNEMLAAASDLAGGPILSTRVAYRILVDNGFTHIQEPPDPRARRNRNRNTGDADPTRIDFKASREVGAKGKKCGASYIPKAHKCGKGEGVVSTQPNKVKATTAKALPEAKPKTKLSTTKVVVTALGVVAAAAAITVAIDAQRYNKNNFLESTGDYKTVLKKELKSQGLSVKDKDKAWESYYDKQATNWRKGELVYYKHDKDPQGHFGIYLGKVNGSHQFAMAGAGEKGSVSTGTVNIGEYGTNRKYETKPVVWAKAPDKIQPPRERYSDTEIVRRAKLMLGKPYKFDLVDNNCEAWASSMVSGVPHSKQVERFTFVTKGLLRAGVRINPDFGKREGFTATQMNTWLAMNHRKFVKDADNVDYSPLVDPATLLKPSNTELESFSTIKQYLMLMLMANENNRTDAKPKGKPGKKCGDSYIPKDHECNPQKDKLKTIAKVAAVAGAVAGTALAVKAVKEYDPVQYHTGIASPGSSHIKARRASYTAKHASNTSTAELVSKLDSLKGKPGVINENVEAMQAFMTKANIELSNTKHTDLVKEYANTPRSGEAREVKLNIDTGACHGFAAGDGSPKLYVRMTRKDINNWQVDADDLVAAGSKALDDRAQGKTKFGTWRYTKNPDNVELITAIHESSHTLHFTAPGGSMFGPLDPPASMLGNRTGSSSDLSKALERATTKYGQSDIDDSRMETFAELSVLYVTAGKRLRAEHPLAYDWVDAIYKANRAHHKW